MSNLNGSPAGRTPPTSSSGPASKAARALLVRREIDARVNDLAERLGVKVPPRDPAMAARVRRLSDGELVARVRELGDRLEALARAREAT